MGFVVWGLGWGGVEVVGREFGVCLELWVVEGGELVLLLFCFGVFGGVLFCGFSWW